MAVRELTADEKEELREQFTVLDSDQSGFIQLGELKEALDLAGFKVPGWRVRDMIDKCCLSFSFLNFSLSFLFLFHVLLFNVCCRRYDREKPPEPVVGQRKLSYGDFEHLCCELKSKEVSQTFKKVVSKRDNIQTHGGMSEASAEGTQHSVRMEEELAFSDWINTNLGSDPALAHILPIEEHRLYEAVADGILLCKVVNHSCPDTVDERVINMRPGSVYTQHENLTLALTSAQSIGCNLVNIDAQDLVKGTPHLVLGLLWQIIRIGLFNQISLEQCPGLANLLEGGEALENLMKMSPEAILLRWVNHQLERAGVPNRINNFTSDIKDSEAYTHLLHQIAGPDAGVTKEPLGASDLLGRAELMLQQADKLGCRSSVLCPLSFVLRPLSSVLRHPNSSSQDLHIALRRGGGRLQAQPGLCRQPVQQPPEPRQARHRLARHREPGGDQGGKDLSQLDELSRCLSLCQLDVQRPRRRPHHLPAV
jgi:plastin-3